MKVLMRKSWALTSVGAATLFLAACGGGGGGTDATPTSPGTTPTATKPADSTTTTTTTPAAGATSVAISSLGAVKPAVYTNAEELAAYNVFSNARTTCGFGPVQQSAILDTASAGHINWLALNNAQGHYQTPGTPGFTGAAVANRIMAAGYSTLWKSTTEVQSSTTYNKVSDISGFGALGSRRLLAAPYHLMGAMQKDREIGISVKSNGPDGSGADIITPSTTAPLFRVNVDFASSPTMLPQLQSSTDVLTYPCAGVMGTAYQMVAETPSPVPGRDLVTSPIGQPIYVRLLEGRTLVVTGVTVTGPTGSVALLPTMTKANDPNAMLQDNMALIMPSSPLSPNTTYAVVINGTNNSTAFTRSFSFATGNVF